MKIALVGIEARPFSPYLSLGYLAAFLMNDPALDGLIRLRLRQFCLSAESPEDIAEAVLAEDPDVAAFTCYVWNVNVIGRVAHLVKRKKKSCRVVVGGPEAFPRGPGYLLENPDVDAVIRDEGESTFAQYVRALLGSGDLKDVAGLYFRRDGRVEETAPRPLLPDLSVVPSPILQGLFLYSQPTPQIVVEGARGCLYDCKFCSWQTQRIIRYFPEERLVAELRHIVKNRLSPWIYLADANIFSDLPRGKRLIKEFIKVAEEEHYGTFSVEANPEDVDAEVMEILGSSTAVEFQWGVQSVDPAVQRRNTRSFHLSKTAEILGRFRKNVPFASDKIQLMIGQAGDTLGTIRRSIDWCFSQNPRQIELHRLVYISGSGYARDPKAFPMEVDPQTREVVATDTMTREDFETARDWAIHLPTLQRLFIVRQALYVWGARQGQGAEEPYLRAYENFQKVLAEGGLDKETLWTFYRGLDYGHLLPWKIKESRPLLRKINAALRRFTGALSGDDELAAYLKEMADSFDRESAWGAALADKFWEAVWTHAGRTMSPERVLLVGPLSTADAIIWAGWAREVTAVDLSRDRYGQFHKLERTTRRNIRQRFVDSILGEDALRGLEGTYSTVVFVNAWQPADADIFARWIKEMRGRGMKSDILLAAWASPGDPPRSPREWNETRIGLEKKYDLLSGMPPPIDFPAVSSRALERSFVRAGLTMSPLADDMKTFFSAEGSRPVFFSGRL
ncbi:MAG TPA: cobalamin-dependent protein [Elusimicrobiota bacterium]|nr:cobalamin-dependent protein [Elusimicrobiota bacterium]